MSLYDLFCAHCGSDDVFTQIGTAARWQKVMDYFSNHAEWEEQPTVHSWLCADCWDEAELDDA